MERERSRCSILAGPFSLMHSTARSLAAVLALALLFTVACDRPQQAPAAGTVSVVTTLFPLYDFVRQVGRDKVSVRLLLPPGVESHGFEPRPEDIVLVHNAAVFVYTNRFMEPWAARLVRTTGRERGPVVVDASAGVRFLPLAAAKEHKAGDGHGAHSHGHQGGADPHIWLSIPNAKKMVRNIAAGLAAGDPENGGWYAGNAASFERELDRLDEEFRRGLRDCKTRLFLHGGHSAFGYLADRYGLTYVAAYPASADAEPTPRKFMEIITLMKKNGIRHIYYEELITPRAAQVIAAETGASLLRLHGLHNVGRDDAAAGATYLSLMRTNLEQLRAGLQCR